MSDAKDNKFFAIANVIQVKIDNNIRMLAELHARWEREDKIAEQNSIARVYTITTTSNADVSHVSKPPTVNGKVICVGNVSTSAAKRFKLPENTETLPDKILSHLEPRMMFALLLIMMLLISMIVIFLK